MRTESIGERLRKARVAKGYSLEEITHSTGIPSHYALAMEMDQFKLLPQDKINDYIESYGNAVGLDGISLIHGYRNAREENVETKVPTPSVFDDVFTESEEEKIELSPPTTPIKEETEQLELANKTEPMVIPSAIEDGMRRSQQRHKDYEKGDSQRPLLILTGIAVLILLFVGYVAWQQLYKTKVETPSVATAGTSSNPASSETSVSTEPQSSQPSGTLTVEGDTNQLYATLTESRNPVTVAITLTGSESVWVAVSGTDSEEAGVTLTEESPSYSVTLSEGAVETLITLGNSQEVSVTINNQAVDLSHLTESLAYISLSVQ